MRWQAGLEDDRRLHPGRPGELDQLLAGLRDSVAKTVASLPEHHAYVARYCGVADSEAA